MEEAFSRVPPFFKYAVIPLARKLWSPILASPGFGVFARPYIETAGKQANRSARNAPSEILRLRSG
jgi:hypothetical protein